MMESPFALERELGMQYYATVTPGIGGILRSVPEDFIVDEIPLEKKGTLDLTLSAGLRNPTGNFSMQ